MPFLCSSAAMKFKYFSGFSIQQPCKVYTDSVAAFFAGKRIALSHFASSDQQK